MAYQSSQNIAGAALPAAYTRVIRIFGGKDEGWTGVIGVYASAAAREAGAPALHLFNVRAPYVADQNPYTAVYAEIASLPEYAAAVLA